MKKINFKLNKKTILVIIIILEVLIIAGLIFILFFNKDAANKRLPGRTLSFLKTDGQDIVNENGEKVFLKGVNFGAWLLWEGCALGVMDCPAWPEYKLREEMEKRMSKRDVDKFFGSVLDNFIQEDDFERVKGLGLNFVRLGFHYRYVQENRLTKLDEAIRWAEQNDNENPI
jgi:aryl-phospho-beta-D-glucosidase BglC (GH1 family)